VLLFALRIENDPGRSPLSVETFEHFRLLFYVDFDGDKVLIEELSYTIVGVDLGVQPSAPRSHWCGAEIKKHRSGVLAGFRQSRVDVSIPVNFHDTSIPQIDTKRKGTGSCYRNMR